MVPSGNRNRSRAKARGSEASSRRACWRFKAIRASGIQVLLPRLPRHRAPRNGGLQLGQRDALLAHIFAGAIGVADLARLVALQEQELAGAFVGIDLRRQWRRVGEFE